MKISFCGPSECLNIYSWVYWKCNTSKGWYVRVCGIEFEEAR